MNQEKLWTYIRERAKELNGYSGDGSAFFFLIAAAFIDFLSCATNNAPSCGDQYKKFIKTRFGKIRAIYQKEGVASAIYCILRNGLVHNFSFVPVSHGGCSSWMRSAQGLQAYLFHVKNGISAKKHMTISGKCLFIGAEPFACDIMRVTDEILQDKQCAANILKWSEQHPPLAPLGFFD